VKSLSPRGGLWRHGDFQVTASGAQIAGPAAGGGLVRALTARYAVLADAISFVVSGAFTVAIRKREHVDAAALTTRKLSPELKQGLGYVLRHPLLRPQAICTATSNFFSNVSFSIFLVYAARHWHLSAGLVGVGFGIGSVGWLLGARRPPRPGQAGSGKDDACDDPTLRRADVADPARAHECRAALHDRCVRARRYRHRDLQHRAGQSPPGDHAQSLQGRMNAVTRFFVWGRFRSGRSWAARRRRR
jgi:hypothetical protein